jgi:hypothetical protein
MQNLSHKILFVKQYRRVKWPEGKTSYLFDLINNSDSVSCNTVSSGKLLVYNGLANIWKAGVHFVLQFRNSQLSPSSRENTTIDRDLNRRPSTLTPEAFDWKVCRYLHHCKLDVKTQSELNLIKVLSNECHLWIWYPICGFPTGRLLLDSLSDCKCGKKDLTSGNLLRFNSLEPG